MTLITVFWILVGISFSNEKKIDYAEPEINKDLDQFAESRARYETLRNKRKPPEKIEKNFGLAGILQVSKSKK